MKMCSKCKIEKDVSLFHASKTSKDGLFGWCKECKSLNRKDSYISNRDKEINQHKEWVANNKERRSAQNVRATRAWQERNLEKVRHWKNDNKHRRRQQYNQGSLTIEEWIELCNKYGNVCLSCGKSEVTIDHIIPLSKGGQHCIENVQPLCGSCNSIKHNKTIDYRRENV